MLMHLNAVDRKFANVGRWAFLGLTYHLREVTARQTKRDLHRFQRRLGRSVFRGVCGFWKLEPQKRGKPHYHLLVYLPPHVSHEAFRAWVVEHWHAVAEPDSPQHLAVLRFRGGREWYQPMTSWGEVVGYCAKYLGKVIENDPDWLVPGKFWGMIHVQGIDALCCIQTYRVSDQAATLVARQTRRHVARKLNGRAALLIPGQPRRTLTREEVRDPALMQHLARRARENGGALKLYRYKPRATRSRSGYAPAEMVERFTIWAMQLHPLTDVELIHDARAEVDRFMRPLVDDAQARARLGPALGRIGRHIYWSKIIPPERFEWDKLAAVVVRSSAEPPWLFAADPPT
jgi:hypothetical protein